MGVTVNREITNRDRIRRIFDILRLDGREIELHFPQYIETGKITDTTNVVFRVRVSGPLLNLSDGEFKTVYVTFVFSGIELFGRCRIINHDPTFVTLDYPEKLNTRGKRRFPRVRLSQKVPAHLRLKQYPEKRSGSFSSRDLPVKYSKIFWEVKRETVDIKKVFILVGAEIKKISPHARIILYNKELLATRDVRLLRRTGKVLYIDDCRKVQSYTRFIPSDKLISYSIVLNEERERGSAKEKITGELKSIIRENLSEGVTSKALVPVFSKDEVIGHIRCVHKESGRKVGYENIADLMSLSGLLTMAVEKAGFVPELGNVLQSSLVDISEGGLLIKIPDPIDLTGLETGSDMEIKFLINGKDVLLKGNVSRLDEQAGEFAIQFTDIKPSDRQVIKQFVDASIARLRR